MVRRCFVIMPFSKTTEEHTEKYWSNFFFKFIKPSVESIEYSCRRSQAQPSNVMKDILTELINADLVIAVLTDFNANVWYELGISHCRRRGTIMIIEEGQKLPFDISQYGVLMYQDTVEGAAGFTKNLQVFIERLENLQSVDNPVAEFLGPITQYDYLILKEKLKETIIRKEKIEQEFQDFWNDYIKTKEENKKLREKKWDFQITKGENIRIKGENKEFKETIIRKEKIEQELMRRLQVARNNYIRSKEENKRLEMVIGKTAQRENELLRKISWLESENSRLRRRVIEYQQ